MSTHKERVDFKARRASQMQLSARMINDPDCLVVIYRNEVFSLDPALPLAIHAERRERLNALLTCIDGEVVRREIGRHGGYPAPGSAGLNRPSR